MRRAVAGLLIAASPAAAQPPARLPPAPQPADARMRLEAVTPAAPVVLPLPENLQPIDVATVSAQRGVGGWQVMAGRTTLHDFGADERSARDVVRVVRDLRPTEWGRVGGRRFVVEYGVRDGDKAPPGVPTAVGATAAVDPATVRAEAIRGVWCVRDDASIVFNCGPERAAAAPSAAVAKKYGFNRVAFVGPPAAPVTAIYYTAPDTGRPRDPYSALTLAAQTDGLTRTGLQVPGLGFVGEAVKIDARKVEARRDGGEWVVAHGPDVFARFGAGDWAARDAARLVHDMRPTEFCRFGTPGVQFFLTSGKAPKRIPLAAQGQAFNPAGLRPQQVGERWTVTDGGRPLFEVASKDEADQLVRLVRHFGFDQVCQFGPSQRASLRFLAKSH